MYEVNGFTFETQEMAEKAQREANGVNYIRSQTKMDDPEVVFKLYNKLLDKKYFDTPVGISFLEELQEYLHSIPFFRDEDIRPIPGIGTREEMLQNLKQDVQKKAIQKRRTEQTANSAAVSPKEREEAGKAVAQNRAKKEARAKAAAAEAALNAKNYKVPFMITSFLSVVFGVVIIGMFVITNISSNNINILNYKDEIINQYESWEKDLEQREAEILQREEELGIERQ